MSFDEEELDPHGECAAEIARLRTALEPFAKISLWRDSYPDARLDELTSHQLKGYINVADMRP